MSLAALAIAYYFGIARPANDRARLTFEQQRYAEEQQRQSAKNVADAAQRKARTEDLEACLTAADADKLAYLKLNGTITSTGTIRSEDRVVQHADEELRANRDACFRHYPSQ